MKLFYIFIGVLATLFVGTILWGIMIDAKRKHLRAEISHLSKHEIESRLSILFDQLENGWAPIKKLEYEVLLNELYKRVKK